jgi:hypothetical protein
MASCGGGAVDIEGFCRKLGECVESQSGQPASDFQKPCVDAFEAQREQAEKQGCDVEFEDYIDCFDSNFDCNSGDFGQQNCNDDQNRYFECTGYTLDDQSNGGPSSGTPPGG